MGDFAAAHSEYAVTSQLDDLRAAEYGYLDEGGHVYLDYTGAGLPAWSQLRAHARRVAAGTFGNPHSGSPASRASTELIEQARAAVLRFFNASASDYAVIFTPNATAACRLVAEAYPFRRGKRLVLTADNHNSVNGIREFASTCGARVRYVSLTRDLRVDEADLNLALGRGHGSRPGFSPTRRRATSAASSTRLAGWRGRRRQAMTCCSTRRPSCRQTAWTCAR
jgi:selenocysteine lyase/cysteine desulfurase